MVPFIDVAGMCGWLQQTGVETAIDELTRYIEADFRRWEDYEKCARIASHSRDGVIELMPVSDAATYAFKYVNGHPANPSRGRQTVTGFGVLSDVRTGYPTFWAEMTVLTALRTAATSVMAARALARPGAATMALIGTGSQAEFQALGFRAGLGIDRLQVWDTDPAAMDKLAANLAPLGFEIVVAGSAEDAAAGADIVTTCTADKRNATVLDDAAVVAGMHLNAIGGDCPGKTELEARTVRRATVFAEYEPQTRIEGEIQQLAADSPVTELWQVLRELAPGRTDAGQITLFDSVGFALEDLSALRYVRDATAGSSHVTHLDLIAEPVDPKDLFALVAPVGAAAAAAREVVAPV